MAGISRSASLVVSYIMKVMKMSCQEATKFVRKTRYQISPNEGFSNSLLEYEKVLAK